MSNFKTNTGMSGGGFTLGTQSSGTGFSFGQPQTSTTSTIKGFLSTPAITSTSSSFNFGTLGTSTATGAAPTGAMPFGTSSALTGQTTAAPAMGGFSLGTAAPATTGGLPFVSTAFTGQTTAVPTMGGFSLGGTAPPATSVALPFGTAVSSALTGQTIAVPAMGGYPTATSAGVGFNFGGAAATATLSGQTTTAPAMGGFALGTATSAAPATAGGFSFGGAPATGATTSTGFTLQGGATITPASSAATPGFSFGGTPASSSGGFAMGGLGGSIPQTSVAKSSAFGFGLPSTTPQSSAAPAVPAVGLGGAGMGLGGAQPPSANAGANSTGAKSDGKSAKKQQLSQDLFNAITVFETWRNGENSASEENIRQTAAPFHKVGKKAEEIQQHLAELASEYLQLHASAVNLKAEVMKEAEHVEMARRTRETPMALQGENKSPDVYFINLVRNFEAEMIYCRNKIDEVSLCMQAANNPCETPDDIAEVLQREHEALKELASKVYAKHSQLVELGHRLSTRTVANDQAFFREQSKKAAKTPASAVVRPALGGSSSGLQAFQEQQQRAKAITLGTAPPTMPLAQTSIPSLFGSNTGSNLFSGGSSFGSNTFNLGNTTGNSSFGSKSLFGNTSTVLGNSLNFGMNTTGMQQATSPFSMNSSFNPKPFGS